MQIFTTEACIVSWLQILQMLLQLQSSFSSCWNGILFDCHFFILDIIRKEQHTFCINRFCLKTNTKSIFCFSVVCFRIWSQKQINEKRQMPYLFIQDEKLDLINLVIVFIELLQRLWMFVCLFPTFQLTWLHAKCLLQSVNLLRIIAGLCQVSYTEGIRV